MNTKRAIMIDLKEAVRIAIESVQTLYKDVSIEEAMLEEAELSEDGQFWLVTVSFLRPVPKSPIEAMTGQHGALAYKILKIQTETGTVQSMKSRMV